MKFKKEDLIEMMDGDSEVLKLIEESEWVSSGKYEYCDYVFEFEDKFYEVSDGRSGSYFTDWYYTSQEEWEDEVECAEVCQKEKIVTAWVPCTPKK